MNFLARIFCGKHISILKAENEKLTSKVEALKRELEITQIRKMLAEEQAIESLKLTEKYRQDADKLLDFIQSDKVKIVDTQPPKTS